jgi:TatD DNase family protein
VARPARRRGWPATPEPLPAPVVDNHTHLDTVVGFVPDDPGLDTPRGSGERPGGAAHPPHTLADHLELAAAVGVTRMVQIGCDVESARWTDAAVREHAPLIGGVAIHPNEAVLHAGVRETAPDGLEPTPQPRHEMSLDDAVAAVAGIAAGNRRIRVLGETGLDHFRAGERGRAVQRDAFRAHVALAKELDLVLQIHDRDAHDEVIDLLERDGAPARTVFHCFSGDAAMARRCAEHGWYLSFAGPISYPANESLREALRVTPVELVLVETDAPYLAAQPVRGQPNAPYLLPHTVRAVAETLGLPVTEACARIDATATQLYGA